jgi:hypothetical protein
MIVGKVHSFLSSGIAVGSHNCDVSDRDILIEEARNLFGDDAVIPVSNFNTLKLKSLIKDIAKFYDVPFEEVNEMTGPLQSEVEPHARGEDVEKSVFVLKHEDCMKYSERYRSFMEKYPEVAVHVETLFMENRSCFSKHTMIQTDTGEKPLSDIDPSIDKVAYVDHVGRIRYNDLYEIHHVGKRKTYKVTTEDNRTLTLTGDHEVLTQDGYKRVDSLTVADYLVDFCEQ